MGKSKSHGDTAVVSASTSDVSKSSHSEKKRKSGDKSSSKHKSSSTKVETSVEAAEEDVTAVTPETVAPVEDEVPPKKKSKKSKKSAPADDSEKTEVEETVAEEEESASRKISTAVQEDEETPASSKKEKKDKKKEKKDKKKDKEAAADEIEESPKAAGPADDADSDDEIIIHKRGADSNFNASPAKKSNGPAGNGGGSTPRGESTSIFVRGLMFGITADQVKEHFADCGEVTSIRFISNDHGQCFVDFSTVEAAGAACKKDGLQGPGDTDRYCNIREHTFGKWFNECAVFVEADSSVEDALREQLGYYGEIADLQFNESGALIVFSSPSEAEAAIEGGKVNLGNNYSPWVKMAMFKEHYGLGQPRDFGNNNGQRGGGRGGSRGGNGRGGRGGGRGGQRGGRGGGRGGNRY